MPGFRCPFCNQNMSITTSTYSSYMLDFDGFIGEGSSRRYSPHATIDMYKCPNDECKKITFAVTSNNDFLDRDNIVLVHPRAVYQHYPDYVPQAIRDDYEEACIILNSSPKASATLARRCLQGMIRDYWEISGMRNLNQEIQAIRDKVTPSQWAAIDATRKIGNIGAHMEQDVNLIIDVEPDEAKRLLRLIELLIEKWYIGRHDEEALLNQIIASGDAITEARNQ